jgi:splicing factor 3B subunit 3
MISAIEKQKLVYVMNRDTAGKLTISSPLEAAKNRTIVYAVVGVDVGFDNPVFAALEVDYDQKLQENKKPIKMLTFYELDLGLNHVTRKASERCEDDANMLIPVPGTPEGPGGVLVCSENSVSYMDMVGSTPITAPIPRRFGQEESRGVLLVSYASHVQKTMFFFLVQSEFGDLYKITLSTSTEEGQEPTVLDVTVKYFDTIPVATTMAVLKTGFLFTGSESSNHYLFQFQGIGDDDDTPSASASQNTLDQFVYFQPRQLVNLLLVDELESLCPITDMKVAKLTANEQTPQIYTLCGRGPRSTLRVLRHGLAVQEMAVSELPGIPTAVWSVKKNSEDEFNSYIVVSFLNATIVLSITGGTVVEVNDTGILDSTPTLSLSLLGENALLQVHPTGLRYIRPHQDAKSRAVIRKSDWNAPANKTVVCCAVNSRQLVIALSGGELVYFEIDKMGQLMDVHRKETGLEVCSLAIAPVQEGRRRAEVMAVGSTDNTVRVLSLKTASPFVQLTMQAFPAAPHSLLISNMDESNVESLSLYVGLQNGVLYRSGISNTDASLTDTRKRFLGPSAVKLFAVNIREKSAVLALSSRSWLAYNYQGKFQITPLSYETLYYASSFCSEQCPEGVVCISTNTLRIVAVEKLGELFNSQIVPLRYTPRKFVIHPDTNNLVIIESDQNVYRWEVQQEMKKQLLQTLNEELGEGDASKESTAAEGRNIKSARQIADEEGKDDEEMEDQNENENLVQETKSDLKEASLDGGPSDAFVGVPHAGIGRWASCIRVIEPSQLESTFLLELPENEAAFSLCILPFQNRPGHLFLAVGTIQNLVYAPQSFTAAFIHIYQFVREGAGLQLLHKTQVSEVPLALAGFQGKLLAGVGKVLRIYELGKRKLLRKTECRGFPTTIQSLNVSHDRIFLGDIAEAFHIIKYRKEAKQLVKYCESSSPCYLTSACVMDYNTMAAADKFGNILITRVPMSLNTTAFEDPSGGLLRGKYGEILQGDVPKLEDVVHYHVGETITSIQKAALVPGPEILIYTTILGAIGIFIPFLSREKLDFFAHLEMHLRGSNPPLAGRDHMAFRSAYWPVKSCTDGDLCEQFVALDFDKQTTIAEELVCKVSDVHKELEAMRNRVL